MKLNILKSREAQIGGLIIVILALFIWGFNFLKGRNILTPANYYYCEFEDVGGLMESNFVMVRGFKVGLVEDIELSKDNSKLLVTMVLEDENIKIPKNSKAVLYDLDLLGTKAIKLEMVPGDAYYESGDTIKSNIAKGMMGKLQDQLDPLVDNIKGFVERLNNLLADSTVNNLKATIANIDSTTASVKAQFDKNGDLGQTIRNIKYLTYTLNDKEKGIAATLANVNAITDSLAKVDLKQSLVKMDAAISSLNSILAKADKGEGTLGNLINDSSLYYNLDATAASLDKLLTDMENQPSKYVHLSLIDWGKDVYIDEQGVTQRIDEDTYFAILVKKTSNAVSINKENFIDPTIINEQEHKGSYYYTIGNYKDYSTAHAEAKHLKETYPSAEVISLDGKKIIPLEKAINN